MPTGFGINRPRLELTGLEEPEELWDRLQEVTGEARSLAASNKKLEGRVRMLERQLSEAGALTDDELVAELPKRMSRALESAQGVAVEIVRRARKQEAAIRTKAGDTAAAIVKQAEAQASTIVGQATKQAAAHIAAAEAEALDIISGAEDRRKQVLSEMEDEALKLEQRLRVLRRDQSRLLHAYDTVERTLVEARAVLREAADPPRPDATASRDLGVSRNGTTTVRRTRTKPTNPPAGVYDWSPVASSAG